MSLFIASLNSGSNGNCYYLGNSRDAVLIDAGISCRQTKKRMERLGLSMDKVRAIFVSHEHSDHTRGAEVLSRRHRIPVYITSDTHKYSRLSLDPGLIRSFKSNDQISIGSLLVHPLPKRHDGINPHSFTVTSGGITTGVFTDIGIPCENVIHHVGKCHAAFLEANYDEKMLDEGPYPVYLKKRIKGEEGHLSNFQALELFLKHRAPFLKVLVLSHLSAQNNHPKIVHDLFIPHANGTHIAIASRHRESELFMVKSG